MRPRKPWQLNDGTSGSSVGLSTFSNAFKPRLGAMMQPVLGSLMAPQLTPPAVASPMAPATESGAGRFAGIKSNFGIPSDAPEPAPLLSSANDLAAPIQSSNGWISTTPDQAAQIAKRYATPQRLAFGGPTRNLPY